MGVANRHRRSVKWTALRAARSKMLHQRKKEFRSTKAPKKRVPKRQRRPPKPNSTTCLTFCKQLRHCRRSWRPCQNICERHLRSIAPACTASLRQRSLEKCLRKKLEPHRRSCLPPLVE